MTSASCLHLAALPPPMAILSAVLLLAAAPAGAQSAGGGAGPAIPAAPPSIGMEMPGLGAPEGIAVDAPPPVAAEGAAPAVPQGPGPALGPVEQQASGAATPPAADEAEAAGGAGAPGEPPAGGEPVIDPSTLPHDLSPVGMFLAADWVVKGVMIALAAASALTWTVFVVKVFELAFASRRVKRAIRIINRSATLAEARAAVRRRGGPAAFMIRSSDEEYARSYAAVAEAGPAGLKERVASILSRIEAQAGRRLARGTGVLASIGSVAPFVGLFGTVWGIMNAFIGISQAQTTNLAVVAPGIAEALLATAIGLVAAIPAVIIYNVFARAVTGYRLKLADAGAGIERLVSRDLDFRVKPAAAPSRSQALAAE